MHSWIEFDADGRRDNEASFTLERSLCPLKDQRSQIVRVKAMIKTTATGRILTHWDTPQFISSSNPEHKSSLLSHGTEQIHLLVYRCLQGFVADRRFSHGGQPPLWQTFLLCGGHFLQTSTFSSTERYVVFKTVYDEIKSRYVQTLIVGKQPISTFFHLSYDNNFKQYILLELAQHT